MHLQDTVHHLKETMQREHLPLAEMEREREAFREQIRELEMIKDNLQRQLEEEKATRDQFEVRFSKLSGNVFKTFSEFFFQTFCKLCIPYVPRN